MKYSLFEPERSGQYFIYSVVWWFFLMGVFLVFSSVRLLPNVSHNGYTLRVKTCEEYGTGGRFDTEQVCEVDGEAQYLPAGKKIRQVFIYDAIIVTLLVSITGIVGYSNKRKKEWLWILIQVFVRQGKISNTKARKLYWELKSHLHLKRKKLQEIVETYVSKHERE